MRNTYVMAAVVALGLVAPVAFFAGQYVSQNDERVVGTALNQGDGGNGLTGLPGGGDPGTNAFSWGMEQPANTYGGIQVQGRMDGLGDLETFADHKKEIEPMDHKDWIIIESLIVPSDWDGIASGKRIHQALTAGNEHGVETMDKATPKLFVSVSYGEYSEDPRTRAFDCFLKIDSVVEPDSVSTMTNLDEQNPSVGGRIWLNFSLNYEKVEITSGVEEHYFTYIEIPKNWLSPLSTTEKSSPLLYLAIGANPEVAGADSNTTFDWDLSMVYDTSVEIILEPFTHMEDVSFVYGHMEDVSLTYMNWEDISFTFEHLEDISFTYGQVREGGWDLTENKGG